MTWHQNAGAAIKRAREACGLSQTYVARRAGVSQPLMSRIERGRRTETASFLRVVSVIEDGARVVELPTDLRNWLTDCANAWTVPTEGAAQ